MEKCYFRSTVQEVCYLSLLISGVHRKMDASRALFQFHLGVWRGRLNPCFRTLPSRPQVYSQRWGQMGASNSVCLSMNWKTRSLCMPSIASSRYLSLAACVDETVWRSLTCNYVTFRQRHYSTGFTAWPGWNLNTLVIFSLPEYYYHHNTSISGDENRACL